MKMYSFVTVTLMLIAIFLVIVAIRPSLTPNVADAKPKRTVEYKVVTNLPALYYDTKDNEELRRKKLEQELNKYGDEGWEVVHFDNNGKVVFMR